MVISKARYSKEYYYGNIVKVYYLAFTFISSFLFLSFIILLPTIP
nr:MAG TPA: hypothetical protein [Caudoviricetes sp.]